LTEASIDVIVKTAPDSRYDSETGTPAQSKGGIMGSGKDLSLKGYTLPLSPEGRASLIDAPPWHYGGDVMHLIFRADERKARALIPPPLEPGPNPGEGVVWFVEWVSVSDTNPELAFVNPERSLYRECIVMLSCQFDGVPGYYVPYIWVDNDFTLMRGFIQGFPKKLGRVHMTKLHDLTPKVGGRRVGAKMKGICVAHEERLVEGSLVFTRQVGPDEVPPVKFYLMRHVPDFADPAKPLVHDIVISEVTNVSAANAWAGDARIEFFPSPFEEVADLGPVTATSGFSFSLGLTITGGKVLHRYT
jgi:acetoacetate decarboxylase